MTDTSLLHSAIQAHIRSLNVQPKTFQPVITEEVISHMAESLTTFCHEGTKKFISGQLEHGGDIRDRNLARELAQEQYDSFWYHSAQSWPKKL